ncbi:MAG: tRNA uridine-5-carboxymethylaminomethyl(34) synthesis GTPase MnmE [Gammaproteobacteria bacterium]|nr:tRNA uridine-5-carboxymethylaminomethyl(34) synthesis GTPase MnmE [Gammaproteobacteria bacterium]MDH3465536.1 tRNA uridine-5-carboxymethylaminomethyl(34) synthesis GTPase MnmE [Gammaproteobacteria bacterium]
MTCNPTNGVDTIVAVATPPGRGGIGIVRISGPASVAMARAILGNKPTPRHAHYGSFCGTDGVSIDNGVAIFFAAPDSYTGEDVLELHGHGSPVVLDLLVSSIVARGARLARPGEFTERAFLNDKMDLVQAEAVADLIDSGSEQAARAALRSLEGGLSSPLHAMSAELTELRVLMEAAIDFPEEELDVLGRHDLRARTAELGASLKALLVNASQGQILRDGLRVVLAGAPNAGKSSLLNALLQTDRAIVNAAPGTTRDLLEQTMHIDGMPVQVIDTAGLRDSADAVEAEGIRRAQKAMEQADRVVLVVDDTALTSLETLRQQIPATVMTVVVYNKIDISGRAPGVGVDHIALSALTLQGMDDFRTHLKQCAGYLGSDASLYSARRRHIDAIERATAHIESALGQLRAVAAVELAAEELRLAQHDLGQITGDVSSDDLLGQIFSTFCIGK